MPLLGLFGRAHRPRRCDGSTLRHLLHGSAPDVSCIGIQPANSLHDNAQLLPGTLQHLFVLFDMELVPFAVQDVQRFLPSIRATALPSSPFPGQNPQVVDFQITLDDAIRRFESYQAQRTRYFHATGILRGADVAWEAALLPFWAFTAALRVDCKAKLGFAADRNNPRSQVRRKPGRKQEQVIGWPKRDLNLREEIFFAGTGSPACPR